MTHIRSNTQPLLVMMHIDSTCTDPHPLMEGRSWMDAWLSVLLVLAAPKQECSLIFITDFRYAASYIHRCAARPCAGSERFHAKDLTDACSMEFLMPSCPHSSTSI